MKIYYLKITKYIFLKYMSLHTRYYTLFTSFFVLYTILYLLWIIDTYYINKYIQRDQTKNNEYLIVMISFNYLLCTDKLDFDFIYVLFINSFKNLLFSKL